MFNYLLSLFSNDMGIDLGTASVIVYMKDKGIVLKEPSVVAIDTYNDTVVAIGDDAKKMIGKTPANVTAIRPLRDGVIANFDATEKMVRYFIKKVHNRRTLLHPRVVIGVPSNITQVERRSVSESAEQAGAREVHLISEPMAAAIGAGIPVHEPRGSMIVDIGGGTTEVAVISLGELATARSLKVAGDKMDEAIISYFRREYKLAIGESSAEDVKIKIGSVYPLEKELSMEVRGLDLQSGLPKAIRITSQEIRTALSDPAKQIVNVVKSALEDTKPELSADLIDSGIILSGGSALIRGLPELLREETQLPVNLAEDPETCVARGTGAYLESLDNLKKSKKHII